MAASDHLAPEQLAMFMTARELHRMPSSDASNYSSPSNMWRSKRRDNERDGLAAHVAEHGVYHPVAIAHNYEAYSPSGKTLGGKTVIWEGHHRIDAAFKADPESLVPVHHLDYGKDTYSSPRGPVPGWDDKPRFPSYP